MRLARKMELFLMINYYTASVKDLIEIKTCKDGHLFDYWSEMISRDESGFVHCRCARCGKDFKADCGVNLGKFGRLAPLHQYGAMFA